MKVLLLVAHVKGNTDSHSHKLAAAAESVLSTAGHEIRVVSLADSGFDTTAGNGDSIDVNPNNWARDLTPSTASSTVKEQIENMKWATHVIVFAPLWFMRLPACFYAYMEKVTGAALNDPEVMRGLYKRGPYVGKKAMLVVTTGNILRNFTYGEGISSIDGLLFETMFGSFYLLGFDVIRSMIISGFMKVKRGEQDEEVVEQFKKNIADFDSRPLIPYKFEGAQFEHSPDDVEMCARLENLTPIELKPAFEVNH